MLAKRRAAMDIVIPELIATESVIDAAILQSTRLTASLIDQRSKAGLSAVIGHAVVERANAATTRLVAARKEVIAAHEELGAIKKQIGLGAVLVGGGGDKPDAIPATGIARPDVHAVA